MSNEKIMSIEASIEPVIKAIMIEMKCQREVNEQLVNQIIELLSEYKDHTLNESVISKAFTGKLFYMFSTLVYQAKSTKYNSATMEQIFRLRVSLLDIFIDI